MKFLLADVMTTVLPSSFLSLYVGSSLNSHQDRVTAITETTGNCTLEASPLLQINNSTSTVHKLFIYSEAKFYKFLSMQGIIWPFNIIRF
jgi:hypothetical protein